MPLMRIRGVEVNQRYIGVTILWQVLVVALWPPLVLGFRRAYLAYTRSDGKLINNMVYWVHLAALVVLLSFMATDPAGIIFDVSGLVNLVCLLEVGVINYSHLIYSFGCSVQHYAVLGKLNPPKWISRFTKGVVVFNFVVGQILIVIQCAIDRVYLSGLTSIFLALEGLVCAPLMMFLVWRLTDRLKEQFKNGPGPNAQKMLHGVRHFRIHTIVSGCLMLTFTVIVSATSVPRLSVDQSLVHSNDARYPLFTRHRAFREAFSINWIAWFGFASSAYFLYRHWINKSSHAGMLTRGSNKRSYMKKNSESSITKSESRVLGRRGSISAIGTLSRSTMKIKLPFPGEMYQTVGIMKANGGASAAAAEAPHSMSRPRLPFIDIERVQTMSFSRTRCGSSTPHTSTARNGGASGGGGGGGGDQSRSYSFAKGHRPRMASTSRSRSITVNRAESPRTLKGDFASVYSSSDIKSFTPPPRPSPISAISDGSSPRPFRTPPLTPLRIECRTTRAYSLENSESCTGGRLPASYSAGNSPRVLSARAMADKHRRTGFSRAHTTLSPIPSALTVVPSPRAATLCRSLTSTSDSLASASAFALSYPRHRRSEGTLTSIELSKTSVDRSTLVIEPIKHPHIRMESHSRGMDLNRTLADSSTASNVSPVAAASPVWSTVISAAASNTSPTVSSLAVPTISPTVSSSETSNLSPSASSSAASSAASNVSSTVTRPAASSVSSTAVAAAVVVAATSSPASPAIASAASASSSPVAASTASNTPPPFMTSTTTPPLFIASTTSNTPPPFMVSTASNTPPPFIASTTWSSSLDVSTSTASGVSPAMEGEISSATDGSNSSASPVNAHTMPAPGRFVRHTREASPFVIEDSVSVADARRMITRSLTASMAAVAHQTPPLPTPLRKIATSTDAGTSEEMHTDPRHSREYRATTARERIRNLAAQRRSFTYILPRQKMLPRFSL